MRPGRAVAVAVAVGVGVVFSTCGVGVGVGSGVKVGISGLDISGVSVGFASSVPVGFTSVTGKDGVPFAGVFVRGGMGVGSGDCPAAGLPSTSTASARAINDAKIVFFMTLTSRFVSIFLPFPWSPPTPPMVI